MANPTPGDVHAGFYYLTEAAQLAQLEAARIRRWVQGYSFETKGGPRTSPPLFQKTGVDVDRTILTFLDLIEICFVREFLDAGVSFRVVRLVQHEAAAEFGVKHPFCVKRFETDGQTIIHRMRDRKGVERLIDRHSQNVLMKPVYLPLLKKLDYAGIDQEASRWWPLGKKAPIVIDPSRAFGEAIVDESRVPTRTLFAAYLAGESVERIADWYRVSVKATRAAIDFEKSRQRRRPAA